jgi:hypothetical protein
LLRWADQQQGTIILPKVRFLSGEERVITPWAFTQAALVEKEEAMCVRVQVRVRGDFLTGPPTSVSYHLNHMTTTACSSTGMIYSTLFTGKV